jgi:hypothetical protein
MTNSISKTTSTSKDWRDLTYLLHGTKTQRAAYYTLQKLQVFTLLAAYDPILAGTIPLDIDILGSDLDIVCHATDTEAFAHNLHDHFGHFDNFRLQYTFVDGLPTVISQFKFKDFTIEIFGQPRPVMEQNAVRHMIAEERLLRYGGQEVRRRIRLLKEQGLKTEPAFAAVFGLPGDPYRTLLHLAEDEEKLVSALSAIPQYPSS